MTDAPELATYASRARASRSGRQANGSSQQASRFCQHASRSTKCASRNLRRASRLCRRACGPRGHACARIARASNVGVAGKGTSAAGPRDGGAGWSIEALWRWLSERGQRVGRTRASAHNLAQAGARSAAIHQPNEKENRPNGNAATAPTHAPWMNDSAD